MTLELAKKLVTSCCNNHINQNNFEYYFQDQYLKHNGGKSFWEQLSIAAENHDYLSGLPHGFKDQITNYCAKRIEQISQEEELKDQLKRKDQRLAELQKKNFILQEQYLTLATEQLKQRHIIFIIGAALGIVAGTIPVLFDRYIPNTKGPTQVQILDSPKNSNI